MVKNPPAMREIWIWSLGWEDLQPNWIGRSQLGWEDLQLEWLPTPVFRPREFRGLYKSIGPQKLKHNWAAFTFSFFSTYHSVNYIYHAVRYIPQFSCSVVSDSLWPHGLQHAKLPCPSPSPRACSNSCPLSQRCHPTISSSVIPFSSYHQSFTASGSFPVNKIFTSCG